MAGWDGAPPRVWSQAMATTPAHSAFLQPLTSPPSNQERGEESRDGGLVVVLYLVEFYMQQMLDLTFSCLLAQIERSVFSP